MGFAGSPGIPGSCQRLGWFRTSVRLETSKVAMSPSPSPSGTVAGVQLVAVFQFFVAELRFQVALPADMALAPPSKRTAKRTKRTGNRCLAYFFLIDVRSLFLRIRQFQNTILVAALTGRSPFLVKTRALFARNIGANWRSTAAFLSQSSYSLLWIVTVPLLGEPTT